ETSQGIDFGAVHHQPRFRQDLVDEVELAVHDESEAVGDGGDEPVTVLPRRHRADHGADIGHGVLTGGQIVLEDLASVAVDPGETPRAGVEHGAFADVRLAVAYRDGQVAVFVYAGHVASDSRSPLRIRARVTCLTSSPGVARDVNNESRMWTIRVTDTSASCAGYRGRARRQRCVDDRADERLRRRVEGAFGVPPDADVPISLEITNRSDLQSVAADHGGGQMVDDADAEPGAHHGAEGGGLMRHGAVGGDHVLDAEFGVDLVADGGVRERIADRDDALVV